MLFTLLFMSVNSFVFFNWNILQGKDCLMYDKNINLLRNFILFSELSAEELEEISHLLKDKTYPAQCTIFIEEEQGDKVYFLKSGRVKVIKSTPDGDEQILEIIQPGDLFGEVVLFGVKDYPATTITMSEVKLSYLTRQKFRNYFNNNPEIGWGMLKVMARKLARSQRKIENLGLRNTRGRLASLLLNMEKDFGDGDNQVILDFNQQEIANLIGTSRETVSRTLSQFKKNNIIKIKDNKLVITAPEKLKKLL